MSGGSMDYLYSKVEDAAFVTNTPQRKAFMAHLKKVVKALHDIEWVDSCDYGKGDENEAIMACVSPRDILSEAIADALAAKEELRAALKLVQEAKP